MSEARHQPAKARSWRDIPQDIAPQRMSRVGRRRLNMGLVRIAGLVVALGALSWGGFEIWKTLQHDPQRLTAGNESRPIERIDLQTNGVLDDAWLTETLAIAPGTGLMELDLYALRSRLTASGQVRTAVLVREFPTTLKVTLEERSPVVRMQAKLDDPEPRTFYVAHDGTIYDGQGYETRLVRSLPWLGGVRLRRAHQGFEPLEGIAQLADLLATARGSVPDIFATWRVVSLERLSADGQILVQSTTVPKIIFGVREDFYSQIARLDLILDETGRRTTAPLRSIDLSVGPSQVPVALNQSLSVFP
jgi:hypothetical protein